MEKVDLVEEEVRDLQGQVIMAAVAVAIPAVAVVLIAEAPVSAKAVVAVEVSTPVAIPHFRRPIQAKDTSPSPEFVHKKSGRPRMVREG